MYRFLIIFFLPTLLAAQARHDYQWLLGDHPNDPGQKSGGTLINFNFDPPHIKYFKVGISSGRSYQPICNGEGELLFYTNGCELINSKHEFMLNGNGLSPGWAHQDYCPNGGYPSQQLCLPFPSNPSKYGVFHPASHDLDAYLYTLYLTTVDVKENGGLGTVIEKNKIVLQDTLDTPLCAVKHGNGRDWWITVSGYTAYAALMSPQGIEKVVHAESPSFQGGINGQACFSPDGGVYCHHTGRRINLYNFDRCTGMFEARASWDMPTDSVSSTMGGIAVSPNSRLLYVTTGAAVHQFDLEAANIAASDSVVYRAYTPGEPIRTTFYQLQLAPDGKIYGMPFSQTTRLHVIRQPDRRGRACEIAPESVELPTKNWIFLPYFPNYRLEALSPSPCDTLTPPPAALLQVSPNPASDQIEVAAGTPADGLHFELFDALGRLVLRQGLGRYYTYISVDWLPSAPYFYHILNEGKRVQGGKLLVRH